jgi:hypothetical protein
LFVGRVSVPPYCGVPNLSHQFPVVALVAVVVVIWVALVVLVRGVEVIEEVIVVDVVVDVFVDVEQDAKTSEMTMKLVNDNQIAPFFI